MVGAFTTGDSSSIIANKCAGGDWGLIISEKKSKIDRATLASAADLD